MQVRAALSMNSLERARTRIIGLIEPEHPVGKPPGFGAQLKRILFGSWFNVLLLVIPVSWALHFAKPEEYTLVFVLSFLAIIPLANLLDFATDELAIRVGESLAGLLNATLGNAVELIVAIIALVKCELRIVQSSLIGSILSNLLLVLGLCFFAGGTRFSEQGFAISASHLNSSLLTLSVIGVLIPAAFDQVAGNNQIDGFDNDAEQREILKISRITAVVLLFMYLSYLYFQLFSHKSLYDERTGPKPETVRYPPHTGPSAKEKTIKLLGLASAKAMEADNASLQGSDCNTLAGHAQRDEELGGAAEMLDDEEEIPELSSWMALVLVVVVTALLAVTAEWLVESIDGLASSSGVPKTFIGLILLPLVGNAASLISGVAVSIKDKLTLSISVAAGSSIQIALFLIPFTVTLGWIIGRPVTMLFDPFESLLLYLSVSTVNYVVLDGKANWLKGIILICLYIIVAVVFWSYPGTELTGLLTCSA